MPSIERTTNALPGADRKASPATMTTGLILALVLTLGCGGGETTQEESAAAAEADTQPIVVLDIGTLRADHLGAWGYDRPTSPNLDALAAESVRFEWAFGQAPNTGSAQASLMTGLYPATHGMTGEAGVLPAAAVTLAEALAEQGYVTAAFVDGGYLSGDLGFNQGFGTYDNSRGGGFEAIGPKVIDWLGAHAEENFLLLVHSYDVHTPYAPPADLAEQFTGGLEAPSEGFEPTAERMEEVRLAVEAGGEALPAADLEYAKALYDAEIRALDDWVGKILAEIRRLGLDRRAVIVLVSDHGEEFQEHGSVLHDSLYPTVVRIPLMIRFPGGAKASTVTRVVEAIDLMPTLLDLAGAPAPAGIQGESLMALIEGQSSPPYVAFGESEARGGQSYVALGGYLLVESRADGSAELYNLAVDAMALTDIAADEPERAQNLQKRLESWRNQIADTTLGGEGEASEMDAATLEQLKSLGYIQ